jgi:hypothetical protein
MNYTGLEPYATEAELQYLPSLQSGLSIRQTGKSLGINPSTISRAMKRLHRRAARSGWSPDHDMTKPVPDGFYVKGVSTYYDETGKARGQWVKSAADTQAVKEFLAEALAEFLEGVPTLPAPAPPAQTQADVIPWVQIGDAHIGLLAHAAETGENFDLKIAEQELCEAIRMLLEQAPDSERIVINDLGDATHYDNLAATTAASGHPLDADGRHPKMLRVYSRTMRFIVDLALTKAKHVDVIINQGNHSRINDFWMRELLTAAYGHTGRVHALDNDSVFIPYRMGKTLVMVHHSDKCRPERLVGVMTSDFKKDYGETDYHYIDVGHRHHHFVSREYPGVIIESWNNLAANDKWAHDAGYRARKAITMVYRSKTYGEVGRLLLPIEAVRDRLARANRTAIAYEKAVFTV